MLKVYVVFFLGIAALAAIALRRYWRRFKRMNCTFNYRITDIWAATLGLTPTLAMAASIAREPSHPSDAIGTVFIICGPCGLALLQIAGLAIGRMDLEIRKAELGPATAWTSAVSIVAGAVFGLFAALVAVPLIFSIALAFR